MTITETAEGGGSYHPNLFLTILKARNPDEPVALRSQSQACPSSLSSVGLMWPFVCCLSLF